VAIKVLPEAFVGDAERLARFDREAKLLASLNHPNVAASTWTGLLKSDGVMPYIRICAEPPALRSDPRFRTVLKRMHLE